MLVIEAHGEAQVGSLGSQRFDGLYLYVGSGGLRRIERHRAVANGGNKSRHWHIDYLLGLGELKCALCANVKRRPSLECALARELAKRAKPAIEGFGASDCRCRTHLFVGDGEAVVSEAMKTLRLKPKVLKFEHYAAHN